MEFLKRSFKSSLLSLDMLIGFMAVTYSYRLYLETGGNVVSSLIMIITSLAYFIFYPYYVIKIIDRDKIRAMATVYADLILNKKDEVENNDEK